MSILATVIGFALALLPLVIDGNSNAPSFLVVAVGFALSGLYQGFDLRTVEIGAHDAHPFAIRPIQLMVLLIEMELLWREGTAPWNDRLAIPAVEVGAFNVSVILVGNTHAGPIDVPGLNVHYDAIGEVAIGH